MRELLGLIARFGLVGLVNTAIGFAVIAGLDIGLGMAPPLANACGYAVGIGFGFVLNRGFVFRSRTGVAASAARYLTAALVAFIINQGVLHLAGLALGAGRPEHLAAQLAAMAAYTTALFLICRVWVFRPGRELTAA
jgi:putative flippase GtrA